MYMEDYNTGTSDGFDLAFTLTLKEYRFVTLESTTVNIQFQATGKGTRPDTRMAKVSSTRQKESDSKESLVDKYLWGPTKGGTGSGRMSM